MVFSVVTDYLKDKFRGGSNTVAIHQSKSGGKPQTSISCFAPGIEINPANGENLILTRVGNSNSFVVSVGGTNQNIEPDTNRGERKIYSVSEDGKTIKAIVKFKNDGTLELNGATDSAVLFSELKAGFDTLKEDFNSFLVHVHGSSGTPPVPPAIPSIASIDGSESTDIKLS